MSASDPRRRILVLGAGFTRAFFPNAPLLVDDFGLSHFTAKYAGFPHASRLMKAEARRQPDGLVDIERFLSRLESTMPHDAGALDELAALSTDLTTRLHERVREGTRGQVDPPELGAFARYVVDLDINCITFNYDDVLDYALWDYGKIEADSSVSDQRFWHWDTGYGFVCRSGASIVTAVDPVIRPSTMRLLKLHGSLNWRTVLGSREQPAPGAVYHWGDRERLRFGIGDVDPNDIDLRTQALLDPTPVTIAPVLSKDRFLRRPLFGYLWQEAFRQLRKAREVVFVGYSMPVGDANARILFQESLEHLGPTGIQVVNLADSQGDKNRVKDAYESVFPRLADESFRFDGTLSWVQDLIAGDDTEATGQA